MLRLESRFAQRILSLRYSISIRSDAMTSEHRRKSKASSTTTHQHRTQQENHQAALKTAASTLLQSESALSPALVAAAQLKQLGCQAFAQQQYANAIQHFSDAIEHVPDDATLYSNRSACYCALSQFTRALCDADTALLHRPQWHKAHYRRGQALEGSMQWAQAQQAYKAGLQCEPSDSLLASALSEVSAIQAEVALSQLAAPQAAEALNLLNLSNGSSAPASPCSANSIVATASLLNPESDKFSHMMNWLLEGGAKFSSLYLRYYDLDYRGVHASRDVKKDTVILYVPHAMIMTSDIAKASDIGRAIIESKVELSSSHSFLAAFLLQEKHSESSFWKPYIDILPTEYATIPIFFSPTELAQLKGSFCLQKIRDRKTELRDEYESLCKAVPAFARFTHDEFVWARLVVITRIFGLLINNRKSDGLVAMADMLNHRRPRQTSWRYDDTYLNDGGGFTITTLQPLHRGEQVYDSYGRKCNSRFFVNYGFALDQNEDNQCCLHLEMPQSDPQFAMKTRLLLNTRYGPHHSKRHQISTEYRDDDVKQCFAFLRFIHAQDSEIIYLNVDSESFDVCKVAPISMRNELAVLRHLQLAANSALSEFETSIEEDAQLLLQPGLSFNMRNIILMRKGEKDVLLYYSQLYSYVLSIVELPWKDFKKLAHKCQEMRNQSDPYVTGVLLLLRKNCDNHNKD